MLQLNPHELLHLRGGSASASWSCSQWLQYVAATHKSSGNEEFEDEFWGKWADQVEKCANEGHL